MRPAFCHKKTSQSWISIHAPLAGCDSRRPGGQRPERNFNPRTPCGVRLDKVPPEVLERIFQSTHPLRGATAVEICMKICEIFQSTHPLRGATLLSSFIQFLHSDFNPRTPCGVRRVGILKLPRFPLFQSTHPLRGATDGDQLTLLVPVFQSTHPLRGATWVESAWYLTKSGISIHAPLAGCDSENAQNFLRILR